jgi:hypothetical protein
LVSTIIRRCGRTKGGLNSKLHVVCDGHGRPLVMLLGEGQISHYKGAASMLAAIPDAVTMPADKGYDAVRKTRSTTRTAAAAGHAKPSSARTGS